MHLDPDEYRLDFFLENGFHRRACEICGDFFWTLDSSRTVCGESPCVSYDFMLRRYTGRSLSVFEARDVFIKFFESKGHTPVKPYPLVARWRTDLFLTDASIVVFQPWVTDGIAAPPANPLVLSQPCARLVDLDKVGLTFGRHLTVFEMGGHHAFNYPDRYIYWKSETAEYCHEFMTRVLEVDPLELSYKEAWWAGGGNEGPCLEVIAGGLELATLVYMKFKTVPGGRVETAIKTVDTGYGIERLAWFSSGTPSAFETIYKGILDDVADMLDIERPPEDILSRYSQYTGLVIPKAELTVAQLKKSVAMKAGLDFDLVKKYIDPYEKMCSALDFTRAIAFILAEGVVPSNVKAGYLARLLIRRTYRLLRSLGSEDKMMELVRKQIGYWSRDFPHLREMEAEIIELVTHEIEKFRETLARGSEQVLRELRSLRARSETISADRLVAFYDERGITPDIVSEIAASEGLNLEIPENFYELVAARHLREQPQEVAAKWPEDILGRFGKTRKLYYEQPWSFSFQARVEGIVDGYLVLDSTLFYPEGGGQVGDTGELLFNGKRCRIVDTQIVGDVILHKFEGEPPQPGTLVEGLVDRERRLSIIRHHTATHILIGAVRRVLGRHAWQAGARKEAEMARLDISHHKRLAAEEVRRIEELANEVVARRLPVRIEWLDRNEAEKNYGFSLYQGGEVPLGMIRVVEIPGWDAEACGGLHCENTEDVGLIKITKTERIQDGVERIVFTSGPSALKHIQRMDNILSDLAEILSSPVADVPKKVAELDEELRNTRRKLKSLKEKLMPAKVAAIRQVGVKAGRVTLYIDDEEDEEDAEYMVKLAAETVNVREPAICLLMRGSPNSRIVLYVNDAAANLGYDAGQLASQFCQMAGGRGGGRRSLGQGSAPRSKAFESINEFITLVASPRS